MSQPQITLVNDAAGEKLVRDALENLMQEFHLSPWAWVKDVRIEQGLNAMGQCFRENGELVIRLRGLSAESPDPQRLNNPRARYSLLRIYLHEQLHAHLNLHDGQVPEVIQELRGLYPVVPVGGTEGAVSEFSTYLHLILCTLELDSVAFLLGKERARAMLSNRPFYQFIYNTVLKDTEQLRDLIQRHGLNLTFLPEYR